MRSIFFLIFLAPACAMAHPLDGLWNGTYNYEGGQERPVEFTVQLCVTQKGELAGTVREPNTFGDETADHLGARITGKIAGGRFSFTKVYDGSGGVSHAVDYQGSLEGARVKGQWNIGSGNKGPFEMELKAGTAAESGCAPATLPLKRH